MTVHQVNLREGWDGDASCADYWYADATLKDGLPPPPTPMPSYAAACQWIAANHDTYTTAGV